MAPYKEKRFSLNKTYIYPFMSRNLFTFPERYTKFKKVPQRFLDKTAILPGRPSSTYKSLKQEKQEQQTKALQRFKAVQNDTFTTATSSEDLKSLLQIKPPTKHSDTTPNPHHEHVGKHPFRMIINGKTGSGKGVLLRNLMDRFYSSYFDRIYWFSKTFKTDPTFADRTWEPSEIIETWDPAMLEHILDTQMDEVKKIQSRNDIKQQQNSSQSFSSILQSSTPSIADRLKSLPHPDDHIISRRAQNGFDPKRKRRRVTRKTQVDTTVELKQPPRGFPILIVIDDFASDKNAMKDPTLIRLAFSGRHYEISIIIITQKYLRVALDYRTNISNGFFFKATNTREADTISDEQACPLISHAEFKRMYAAITRKEHDFLSVYHDAEDSTCMYRKNLTEVIPLPFKQDNGQLMDTSVKGFRDSLFQNHNLYTEDITSNNNKP